MHIFELAAKNKYRFGTSKGSLTVEDLFDLPLTSEKGVSLNSVAKGVNNTLQDSMSVDFVGVNPTVANTLLTNMLEVVKRVIEIKQAAASTAAEKKAKAEKKQLILELIEKKQTDALAGKSTEELSKMLDEL